MVVFRSGAPVKSQGRTIATMVGTQLLVLTVLAIGEPHGSRPCALFFLRRFDYIIPAAPQLQESPLLYFQSLLLECTSLGRASKLQCIGVWCCLKPKIVLLSSSTQDFVNEVLSLFLGF